MTKQEFEDRTGMLLDDVDFGLIDAIYMSCGDGLDKDEFCAAWKAGDWRLIMDRLSSECAMLRKCYERSSERVRKLEGELSGRAYDIAEFLVEKSVSLMDASLYHMAVALAGGREVVLMKLSKRIGLCDEDVDYIEKHLQ